jgi:hypothetical protein
MRLVAGFPSRNPGIDCRSCDVRHVADKAALGQVFYKYFAFPCHFSSLQMLPSITRGWYKGLSSGRRTKWTLTPTPPRKKKLQCHFKPQHGLIKYYSVYSRCYVTTARWADIPGPFLGNGWVHTFALLGSRIVNNATVELQQ